MLAVTLRQTSAEDVDGVVALQRLCFPAPFPADLLWKSEHIQRHIKVFPHGQQVALINGAVVGSATATRISEDVWQSHFPWEETAGGPFLENFDPEGSTLYGLDISVHPECRGLGIGRMLYDARFSAVRNLGLSRYGTACRIPDFERAVGKDVASVAEYIDKVVRQELFDRTLSVLLKYGLTVCGVIENYMEDRESGNAAALLEWIP